MCGIAGILAPGGASDGTALRRMVAALARRGPDGEGIYEAAPIALGHRRLAILDPDPRGNQPMATPDGRYVLAYNGEVYNFRELGRELESRGVVFRTRTDTEVLLHHLARAGAEALPRWNGMFAFALWDARARRLLLGRDRLGVKPLYLAFPGVGEAARILFASTIGALLASNLVPRRLRPDAVLEILALQDPLPPGTILAGVEALAPGSWRSFGPEGERASTWWRPEFPSARIAPDPDETLARFDAAVARRLVSDRPLGVFLSGGVDSSGVTESALRQGGRMRAYTVGFRGDGLGDERPFARRVAEATGAEWIVEEEDGSGLVGDFDDFLDAIDQPSADGLNAYLISRIAARDLRVCLAGTGGDELFGGYDTLPAVCRALAARGVLPSEFYGAAAGRGAPLLDATASERLLDRWSAGRIERAYSSALGLLPLPVARRLLYPDLASTCDPERLLSRLARLAPRGGGTEDSVGALELQVYLRAPLLRVLDATSMHFALEVRFPFLDPDLVAHALAFPAGAKRTDEEPKAYLKAAFARRLPREVLYRRKQGFVVPLDHYLRTSARELVENHLGPAALAGGELLDPRAVRSFLDRYRKGFRGARFMAVWAMLVLSAWCAKHRVAA